MPNRNHAKSSGLCGKYLFCASTQVQLMDQWIWNSTRVTGYDLGSGTGLYELSFNGK